MLVQEYESDSGHDQTEQDASKKADGEEAAEAQSQRRQGCVSIAQERRLIEQISAFWEAARRVRDAAQERTFTTLFGE
jgi:hypothetical protein